MQAQDPEPCGGSLGWFSFLLGRVLRVVKILQVEVEGLLSVKALIVDRRLELPVHFDANLFQSAVTRLRRFADFHLFGHVSLGRR